MRHSIILMLILIYFSGLSGFAQTKLVKAVIINNYNEKLEGQIRRSFKSDGRIVFFSPGLRKRTYSPSEIKSFNVDSINYISYSNDFYKEILSGQKACLYQKYTDNRDEPIYNGVQAVGFVKTTEGNTGDLYLRLSSGIELDLITKKNFKKYFIHLFNGNDSLISKIENESLNYAGISQVVKLYNN